MMGLAWPIRSVIAGFAATAAISLAYWTEHALRPDVHGQLEYDDSLVPGEIVASVLRFSDVTERGDAEFRTPLRWGYGSAFGLWHGILQRRLSEPWASLIFGATLIVGGVLGVPAARANAPPRRWPRDVLATSLATHATYVVTVALVDDRVDRSSGREEPRT